MGLFTLYTFNSKVRFDLQNENDFQRHAKVKQNAIAISRLRKEKHGYFFFWRWGLFCFFKGGNTPKPSLVTWAVIFSSSSSSPSVLSRFSITKNVCLFEDWGVGGGRRREQWGEKL